MNHLDRLLAAIAREHLCIATLETRNRDALDFHEVSVTAVKAALTTAFHAGLENARDKTRFRPGLLAALEETTPLLDACARNAERLGLRDFAAQLLTIMSANRRAIAKARGRA